MAALGNCLTSASLCFLFFKHFYFFMAVLGLRCREGFLIAASKGYSLAVVLRLLTAVASLGEHRLQGGGFGSCGAWA